MAFDRVVKMLCEGVVDDPDERDHVMREGEGDGYVGEGVHEVCGSVDGVDDERRRGGEE